MRRSVKYAWEKMPTAPAHGVSGWQFGPRERPAAACRTQAWSKVMGWQLQLPAGWLAAPPAQGAPRGSTWLTSCCSAKSSFWRALCGCRPVARRCDDIWAQSVVARLHGRVNLRKYQRINPPCITCCASKFLTRYNLYNKCFTTASTATHHFQPFFCLTLQSNALSWPVGRQR